MRSLRFVFALGLLAFAAPRLSADDLVKWRPIPAGEAESKKTGKPVLYFMTAEWCGPCRTMRSQIFADPKMAELVNKTFVPIEVLDRRREEGRNGENEERIFETYRCRGFPTLTVTRPGSSEAFQVAGWSSRESTVEFLKIAKGRLEEMERKSRKETK